MKWWKTALAVLLIALSLFAMYQWNLQGKARLASLQAELTAVKEAARAEAEKDPDEEVYKSGKTFFVIPKDWIYSCSTKVQTGSRVGIYSMRLREKIGSFDVSLADAERIELACTLEEYYGIHDLIYDEEFLKSGGGEDLLITTEAKNE